MDTVKFDIALSRHPPRRTLTPTPAPVAATVPTLSKPAPRQPEVPLHYDTVSGELKVPTPMSSVLDSSGISEQKDIKKEATLSEKFHDWMETDMEHGL